MTTQDARKYFKAEEANRFVASYINPHTKILDIETMALGIVEACKPLKLTHHPVNPCEENGCTDWQGCDEICIYHPDFQKAAQAIHDTAILKEIDAKCKTASENTNVTEIKLGFDMVRLWIKELRESECGEVKK